MVVCRILVAKKKYDIAILLSHKNVFESVLMRWMNLEPIMQDEVSQKEKDKYCILIHIYGVQKDGTGTIGDADETDLQTQCEKERVG